MELYIRLQVQTIAAAFAMGCAAALLYDLLRTLRLARRRRTVTHLTDLVYVLAVGWAFLQFALAIGQGELRLYVLPCAALGAIFSWRMLVPFFRPIWQFWLGAAVYMGRLLWQPVRMLLHFCKKVWISAEKARVDWSVNRPAMRSPLHFIEQKRILLDTVSNRLNQGFLLRVSKAENRLSVISGKLDALSPFRVLGRGYSLVLKQGSLIKTVNDLKKDDGITVKLSDGEAKCQVIGVLPESKEEIL